MKEFQPEGFNRAVRQWSKQSQMMLKNKVKMLTNKNKHQYLKVRRIRGIKKGKSSILKNMKLADSIKYKVRSRFGLAERIIFPFVKHGYYIAIGVSRGHKKNNPRKKIEWYDFLFEERLESLADIAAEKYADEMMEINAKNFK